MAQSLFELCNTTLRHRGNSDERNAKSFTKCGGVKAEALGFGVVSFVQSDDDWIAEIDNLDQQVEVTFEVSCIENAEDEVWGLLIFLITDEDVSGNFFIW